MGKRVRTQPVERSSRTPLSIKTLLSLKPSLHHLRFGLIASMALARCSRLSLPLFLSRPLLFSSSFALYSRFPLPFFLSSHLLFSSSALCRRALPLTCLDIPVAAARFTPLRCQVRWSGDSAYSPLNSGGGVSEDDDFTWTEPDGDWPFPGFGGMHWVILFMDKPWGEGATKEQMIDYYIKTLAKVVGR